jgi:SH3-like domain-containing protein
MTTYRLAMFALVLPLLWGAARAQSQPEKLPRFASLSSDKVFLRQGPGYDYRILWVYHRKGLPVIITAQYDVWRKVRFSDGTVGWVHVAMLSSHRTVLVTGGRDAPLRESSASGASVVALAAPGVIAQLRRCKAEVCDVSVDGHSGWINKTRIWGASLAQDGS